ncbi:MAG: META domain-containing protein [Pseudomonadota bacterium]
MNHVPRWLNTLFLTVVLILPGLIACSPQNSSDVATPGPQSVVIPLMTRPVPDELVNMDYSGIHDDVVTLSGGRWEGEPYEAGAASRPVVGLVEDFYLSGDLDGKSPDEAVAMLWETAGGSGVNSYVAVVGRRDGSPVNIGTALIGDRVQLRAGRIIDRHIELDVIQQGPNDAACCPTETVTRVWEMGVDGLNEGEVQNKGTLSLAYLEGQEWLLVGTAVPDGLEVILTVSQGRVAGQSACNRYFGSITAGDTPGEITLGKLGSTRMACPPAVMELENRYLKALSSVTGYGFLNGKLAMTWQQDGEIKMLLFSARDL